MIEVYDAEYCSLHVRCGNKAAFSLYKDTLGFSYVQINAAAHFLTLLAVI